MKSSMRFFSEKVVEVCVKYTLPSRHTAIELAMLMRRATPSLSTYSLASSVSALVARSSANTPYVASAITSVVPSCVTFSPSGLPQRCANSGSPQSARNAGASP